MSARGGSVRRRALAGALAAAAGAAAPLAAQSAAGTVTVQGPAGDTLPTVTPTFTITVTGAASPPSSIRLQVATDSLFTALVADTTVRDSAATIQLARPLPAGAGVWWRGLASLTTGDVITSARTGPRVVPPWLTLVTPNNPNGTTLDTRRPTFVWSSAPVASPPGPWLYNVTITSIGTGAQTVVADLTDTTYTPPFDLETNSSYRWSVFARLSLGAAGDTVRVNSAATFVITNANRPLATLLYQNFPNPFPTAASSTTCIWFDLGAPAVVQLRIYDLRGDPVRTLIPGPAGDGILPPGRYGRGSGDANAGCDPRFTWDGTADDGHRVPTGVYLLRLSAGHVDVIRKILYRAP